MSYQIIRQPGGRHAIFSTSRQTIVLFDATEDDIVAWFEEQTATRIREQIAHIARDEDTSMSWDEALAKDREHGGEVHMIFSELQGGQG